MRKRRLQNKIAKELTDYKDIHWVGLGVFLGADLGDTTDISTVKIKTLQKIEKMEIEQLQSLLDFLKGKF